MHVIGHYSSCAHTIVLHFLELTVVVFFFNGNIIYYDKVAKQNSHQFYIIIMAVLFFKLIGNMTFCCLTWSLQSYS